MTAIEAAEFFYEKRNYWDDQVIIFLILNYLFF